MTLEEISESLPNGFHDARINSINIDYVKRTAVIDLEVWMAGLTGEDAETYRPARLILSGLLLWVVEPPDPRYDYHEEKALWVADGFVDSAPELPRPLLDSLPDGAFTHRFFVHDWNAFIHMAARSAALEFDRSARACRR